MDSNGLPPPKGIFITLTKRKKVEPERRPYDLVVFGCTGPLDDTRFLSPDDHGSTIRM